MMTKKMFLLGLAVATMIGSSVACGKEPTVDAVVEHQKKAYEDGVECKYIFVSLDVFQRLAHLRICKDSDEARHAKALSEAEEKCFQHCDDTFPDNDGSKTQENLACVAQCKKE